MRFKRIKTFLKGQFTHIIPLTPDLNVKTCVGSTNMDILLKARQKIKMNWNDECVIQRNVIMLLSHCPAMTDTDQMATGEFSRK